MVRKRLFFCFILILTFILDARAARAETPGKLPEIVVSAEDSSRLQDPNERIGTYQQPRWTTSRSFANSRVYVIPENEVGVEFWMQKKVDRASGKNYYLLQKEIEVGIGHGLQLDFYQNDQKDFGSTTEEFEGYQFELRWALAKWGEIFLNPTLYFEYHVREQAADKFEFRLLLGEDFAQNWRLSNNLAYEIELWDQREREIALTAGLARKIANPIMLGAEGKAEGADDKTNRGHFTWEYYLGPSLRWTPSRNTNVLFTHLIGLNHDSHLGESLLIFALEI